VPAFGVRPNSLNLSVSRPEQLPIFTTVSARSAVGMLIAHCRLCRIRSKLWLPPEIRQATSDGENSITMCQPMVMTLVSFLCAELTRTIGPGSSKRRMLWTGKSFFL
jgi:hypothetical protein